MRVPLRTLPPNIFPSPQVWRRWNQPEAVQSKGPLARQRRERLFEFKPSGFSLRVGEKQDDIGYRVNCEVVPCLPARIVTICLSDPRCIPYMLIWKHRRSGVLKEVVRLAPPHPVFDSLEIGSVEVKRWDGSKVSIRVSKRSWGSLLICNSCQKPRRALSGWETNDGPRNVTQALWPLPDVRWT